MTRTLTPWWLWTSACTERLHRCLMNQDTGTWPCSRTSPLVSIWNKLRGYTNNYSPVLCYACVCFFFGMYMREVTLTVTESLLECRYMCIDGMWGGGSCEGRRDYLNGAPVKSGRRDCINGTPVRSGKRNCTNGALVRRERRDHKWCTCEKW